MSTARVPAPPGYQDSPKHRGALVKHAREALANAGHPSEWHVQHFDGQVAVMALAPAAHPQKVKIMLAPNFTLVRAPEVLREAKDQGLTVVEFALDLQPGSRYAVAARVTPAVAVLTGLLAGELGKFPHEIGLNATWSPEGHVEKVWVRNLPTTMSAEKLEQTLRRFVAEIPGGNSSWGIDIDRLAGQGVLSYCPPERLAGLVHLSEILPDRITDEGWEKLALGIDSRGEILYHNLKRTPHLLVCGPTGTGKSIALIALICSALAAGDGSGMGHQIGIVDAIKGGADFMPLLPYAEFNAETLPQAQRAMELAYKEVERRKSIIQKQYGKRNWLELEIDLRLKHNIRPLTILIDEYGSLSKMSVVSKALPKDHPLNVEAEEANAAKAIIIMYAEKISKEARAWGIFLQVALQRASADELGSALRAQLTGRTQLVPPNSGVSRTDLGMVFTADGVESAEERVKTLDHGGRVGLGIIQGDGGMARGLRVAYCAEDEIAPLMEKLGVPRVARKWDLGGGIGAKPDFAPASGPSDTSDFAPVPAPDDNGIDPATGIPWPF